MSEPVGQTCPDIDFIINSIKESVKCLESAKKSLNCEENSDALDNIDLAIREIKDFAVSGYYGRLVNLLEKLRASNSALREWGEEGEKQAEKLERENEELKLQLNTL